MKPGFLSTGVLSAAVLSGIFATQTANAAFVMVLDDPNDNLAAMTIYDGTGNDLNGVNGVITYSGSVGAFTVNVTTGISKPAIGPGQLDLNSIDVSGAAGTLLVSISDTDFTSNAGAYVASYGGTTQGNVDFTFLFDGGNHELGGNAFASGDFSSSIGSYAFSNDLTGAVSGQSPYSLSILAQINHTGANQVTSFDAAISPVPLPASIWLLGSALLGLSRLKRRR